MPPPPRLREIGTDGTRRVPAASRKAPRGTKRGETRAGPVNGCEPPPGDGCQPPTGDSPRYSPAGTEQPRGAANGAPPGRGRPARYPPAQPAPAAGHAHARRGTAHLLDVLPDGGAVVADDEQLQGVIDEAVLRGRARRRHGQAPGGGAPSTAPQHPTPPHPGGHHPGGKTAPKHPTPAPL